MSEQEMVKPIQNCFYTSPLNQLGIVVSGHSKGWLAFKHLDGHWVLLEDLTRAIQPSKDLISAAQYVLSSRPRLKDGSFDPINDAPFIALEKAISPNPIE